MAAVLTLALPPSLAHNLLLLCLLVPFVPAVQQVKAAEQFTTLSGNVPELYAHRGESTLAHENTLPAYELAIILEADFIELDLQLTKDGVLVCHHDLGLNKSTDVASRPEFIKLGSRLVTASGSENIEAFDQFDDWFIKDFTAEELKTLQVKQNQVGVRSQMFHAMTKIPTFAEFLDLVRKMSVKLERRLGIIPELKTPKYHNSILGRPDHYMEDEFLRTMAEFGYPTKSSPVAHCVGTGDKLKGLISVQIECPRVRVQSSEMDALTYLQTRADFDTVLIVSPQNMQLRELTYSKIKQFASQGINELAVWKGFLENGVKAKDKGSTSHIPATTLPEICHQHGMRLSIFTIKDSHEEDGVGDMSKENEMEYFMDLGVDALFVENIAESREIRTKYECARKKRPQLVTT